MTQANQSDFIDKVCQRIKDIYPEADTDSSLDEIRRLWALGATISEATRYCCCFEEVNPKLPEDTALNRMRKIQTMIEQRTQERHGHLP